jgi:hypothetical protein
VVDDQPDLFTGMEGVQAQRQEIEEIGRQAHQLASIDEGFIQTRPETSPESLGLVLADDNRQVTWYQLPWGKGNEWFIAVGFEMGESNWRLIKMYCFSYSSELC